MSSKSGKPVALITGASAGIGAVYADRLARRGHDLILVARNHERLEELAGRLEFESGSRVETIAADLSTPAGLRGVEDTLRTDTRIGILVNNAGIGLYAPTLASDIDVMQSMITLNITALTRLTYAAAEGFVARGTGAIINLSSAVAIAPEMLNAVYGGTKAFVLAFSQALRHELEGKGVRVHVVLPGAVRTEFWANGGKSIEELPPQIVMSAEDMVDAALAGFDLGEFATIPSLPNLEEWQAFESARLALRPKLSLARPAARYSAAGRAAA